MTLATTLLAAALVVPSMPQPEYDDCEVVTNCVFYASRGDAKMFAVKIELDATSSNGVEVVFGRDADGDGRLSRTEAEMSVGYCCGEWKVVNIVTGDTVSCAGTTGRAALDWKLRLNGNRTPRSLAATVNGQPTFTQLVTPQSAEDNPIRICAWSVPLTTNPLSCTSGKLIVPQFFF